MHENLLEEVKLALSKKEPIDEALLYGYLKAAISYSEKYQRLPLGTYSYKSIGNETKNAIIRLTLHYYIMKDGEADLSQKDGNIISEINEQLWIDSNNEA